MALHNQPVEVQVHSLLAKRRHQLALAADVARVAEQRQVGITPAEFDGDVPLRQVAVYLLVVTAEAAVNGTDALQSRIVDAFQGTNPEFQVGVHRVLHQHRDVDSLQGIGNLLHGKGVGAGARADPKQVDARFQALVHMLGCSHFGSHIHARLLLHLLEPLEAFHAYALKAARLGARFPNACPEYPDAFRRELRGCFHHLFFGLCAARAGNHQGTLHVHARQLNRF